MSRTVSILIPTLDRGAIVLETLGHLRNGSTQPAEILILDQTLKHPADVEAELAERARAGEFEWVKLPSPSIPASLNVGLVRARSEIVLILDDDIVPDPDLVASHLRAFGSSNRWAVAGRVMQPWQRPEPLQGGVRREESLAFPFHSTIPQPAANVMAGNLSVIRSKALDLGGFDENFTGAAYRFETDFAWRVIERGGEIWFEPSASVEHLKLATGGLRTFGDFKKDATAVHTSGDYYFARLHLGGAEHGRYVARRLRQNILNRHSLTHPWVIPVRLLGELAGYRTAVRLEREGRRLLG